MPSSRRRRAGPDRVSREFDRLTPGDLMMLWPEDFGWREDIGAIAVLSGDWLTAADGNVRIDAVREHVQTRLHHVPRFRQQLVVPGFGLGGPLWLDCPDFDIRHHVDVAPLPPGADEDDLLEAVAALFARPFDWTRPLWELWLLPGLADTRTGLLIKLHHTMADAQAGLTLLGAFLDVTPPGDAADPVPAWAPEPWPTSWELFRDNARRRSAALGRATQAATKPVRTLRRTRETLTLMRRMSAHEKVPRTSLNRPVRGSERRLAVVRGDVATGKRIAHAHGGTLNDVLLCAAAEGLRDLLAARGEPDDVTLFANVPISMRSQDGPATGNEVGVMFVPLPLGIRGARLLRAIATASAEAKLSAFLPPTSALLANRQLQRLFWRNMRRQRFSNVAIANVPGPPVPLYFGRCRVDDVFPIVSLVGNVTVGIAAMSYAGQLNIAVVGDAAAAPDVAVLAAGLRRALTDLGAVAPAPTSAHR